MEAHTNPTGRLAEWTFCCLFVRVLSNTVSMATPAQKRLFLCLFYLAIFGKTTTTDGLCCRRPVCQLGKDMSQQRWQIEAAC